jgi:hypothetical protein
MSNIYTEFARLYLRPEIRLAPAEIESLIDCILGDRGSYWVPVWYDATQSAYIDLQYGSGKNASLFNFSGDDWALFEEIWVRLADEGSDADVISSCELQPGETPYEGFSERRVCRYGFDEIEVFTQEPKESLLALAHLPWEKTENGWRVPLAGSYSTLNERNDMNMGPCIRFGSTNKRTPGGFPTKTTPCHSGTSLQNMLPSEINAFLEATQPTVTRIDLRYAGRLVHQIDWGGHDDAPAWMRWVHQNADDWDNCIDETFVALRSSAR